MEESKELDDFIQKAVNQGFEDSVNRYRKKIEYKRMMVNKKLNILKRKRKNERQNRKKGR
jgi:hypothetical protein